jgi:tetratricopeptide (TPR) repeat protein
MSETSISPAPTRAPDAPEPELILALFRAEDYAGAMAGAERLTQLRPEDPNGPHLKGLILLAEGRTREAADCFMTAVRRRRAPGGPPGVGRLPGSTKLDTFAYVTPAKLRFDCDQLDHLAAAGALPAAFADAPARHRAVLNAVEAAVARMPPLPEGERPYIELDESLRQAIGASYNRLLVWRDTPEEPGGALAPGLDTRAIEAAWAAATPEIVVIDGLLKPTALERLRRFCLESTIWFQFQYASDYLGAMFEEGFCCPLLIQIAEELRTRLPAIFGPHPLLKAWAYSYDRTPQGIATHADFAAVNVNFWITPDAANRDPDHGGLVVHRAEAPAEWDFEAYNRDTKRIHQFLATAPGGSETIPHRQNRAVVFNSNLFHATDHLDFAPGYANRRINVTMLFGRRQGR